MSNEQQTIWGFKINEDAAFNLLPDKNNIHVYDCYLKCGYTFSKKSIKRLFIDIAGEIMIPQFKIDTLHGIKIGNFYIETDRKKLNALI